MDIAVDRARRRAQRWQLVMQWLSLLVGIGLIARLYEWQVVQQDRLAHMAQAEHVSQETIPASRGSIYDSTGGPLVTNVSYDLVFAVPAQIPDHQMAAEKLAPILGLSTDALLQRLDTKQKWV